MDTDPQTMLTSMSPCCFDNDNIKVLIFLNNVYMSETFTNHVYVSWNTCFSKAYKTFTNHVYLFIKICCFDKACEQLPNHVEQTLFQLLMRKSCSCSQSTNAFGFAEKAV